MTKAKTTAAEEETPSIDTATEGQDTLQATDASGEDPSLFQAADAPDEIPAPPTEEQDAARLDAEAMLAAQAEGDAAGAAEAAQAEAEMAALRAEVDHERLSALTHLAALITEQNVTGHRPGLISDLQDHWGAIFATDAGLGTVSIEICGIKTDPADSFEMSLTNWANAARREIAAAAG